MKRIPGDSVGSLAGLLSQQYHIRIDVGGDDAYTRMLNGGLVSIHLPGLLRDADYYLDYLRGYIDHEVGHVRYTDHNLLGEVFRTSKGMKRLPTMTKNIWNIFEDTYVERRMANDYLGCGRNIRQLQRLVFKKDIEPPSLDNSNQALVVAARICNYILYEHRARAFSELEPYVARNAEALEEVCPGMVDKLASVLDEAWANNDSTEHNMESAEKVVEVLFDGYSWPPEFDVTKNLESILSSGNTNPFGSSDSDSDSNSDSGSSSESGPESDSDSDSEGKNRNKNKNKGKNKKRGKNKNHSAGNSKVDSKAIMEVLAAAQQKEERIGRPIYGISSTMLIGSDDNIDSALDDAAMEGSIVASPASSDIRECDREHYCRALPVRMKNEAMRITARLASQLQALLQAYVMNRGGAFRRGCLDSNKLARIVVNNPKIFMQRVEQRAINTEVIILADMSGSMSGRRAKVLSEGLYALTHAIYPIKGVTIAAYGFSGSHFIPILEMGERPHDKFLLDCEDGTICGSMSLKALSRYSWVTDKRRIFIVMSDGETFDEDLLKLAIKKARKAGIEIVGIGVESEAMQDYVEKNEFVYVEKVTDLPSRFFTVLRDKLILGRI